MALGRIATGTQTATSLTSKPKPMARAPAPLKRASVGTLLAPVRAAQPTAAKTSPTRVAAPTKLVAAPAPATQIAFHKTAPNSSVWDPGGQQAEFSDPSGPGGTNRNAQTPTIGDKGLGKLRSIAGLPQKRPRYGQIPGEIEPGPATQQGKAADSGVTDVNLRPPVGVADGPPWLNFREPGTVNQLYPEIKDALTEPTNSQGVADETIPGLTEPGRAESNADQAIEKLGGDSETKKWVEANMSGLMETPFADWWQMYGDQLGEMTMGELFAEGAIPGLEEAGFGESFTERAVGNAYGNNPEIGARAGEMYDELGNLIPDLPIDPNLGAYYDRAKSRTADSINNQLTARGAYGSSGGLGMLNDSFVGLEAERANREAQYGLGRAAELRGWQGLRSETGAAADLNDVRRSSEERLWLSNLMDAAQGADELGLERVRTAGDLAFKGSDTFLDRFGQQTEGQQFASEEDLARDELGLEASTQVDEAEIAQIIAASGVAQGADAAEVQRAIAASNIASNADAETLKRWIAIYNAAEGASDEKIRTADMYFGQNLAYGTATSGVIGEAADDIEGIETQMTDGELAALLGVANEGVSGAVNTRQMNADDQARFLDNLAKAYELSDSLGGKK